MVSLHLLLVIEMRKDGNSDSGLRTSKEDGEK